MIQSINIFCAIKYCWCVSGVLLPCWLILCCRFSAENEHKLFLLWSKLLELSLRQADLGGPLNEVKHKLTAVAQALWTLGDDKDSSGLLGAIGLGKKSTLSRRYLHARTCCCRKCTTSLVSDLEHRDGCYSC